MQTRRLGRTDLTIAPIVLGGNVFGWTIDKTASFAVLDRFAASGVAAIDTADAYSSWVPGNQGGELETIIGEWMKARGNRNRVDRHHQGRLADGQGQGGPCARLYRGGGRGVAEKAPDRRHRPLPFALARHGDARRRHARRIPTTDRKGQDPLVRRLEPDRDAARAGGRGGQARGAAPATKCCSPNTISPIGPASRTASPTSAGAKRSASSPITAWRKAF